jgi:xylulokinase
MPLESAVSSEGSAYGAALLGGVAARVFADVDEAVERCVRLDEPTPPDPRWVETYDELYVRYCALYPATKGVTG